MLLFITTYTVERRSKDAGEDRQKPNVAEGRVLIDWILSIDERGHPRVEKVREMASYILVEPATTPEIRGWVERFVKRHSDTFRFRFSRKFDYQRARCEDREVIWEWFELVRNTIRKYEIKEDDIYLTRQVLHGVISSARGVTGSEKRGRPKVIQARNREWSL